MNHDGPVYRVRIRGDRACFTRPELKTERVSYHVITPSAAQQPCGRSLRAQARNFTPACRIS